MNIVCIGAHPDDCEVHAGGTVLLWKQAGHEVLLISATNGDIGHSELAGGLLAQLRKQEATLAAERAGCDSLVLDNHDGELMPSLELRKTIVRLIRTAQADVVVTHRPNDYHPDHRYISQAVQDAAFMVITPHFCPDTPRLAVNPIFLYMMDDFRKPYPFVADIAVDVGPVMEAKFGLLDAHASQVYEWLPWLQGTLDTVPEGRGERLDWLKAQWRPRLQQPAQRARESLAQWYDPERGNAVEFAELFEVCEYGRKPEARDLHELFPFLPGPVR